MTDLKLTSDHFSPGKLTLVVDLDETLIKSMDRRQAKSHQEQAAVLKKLGLGPYDMAGHYAVWERPGLQPFLDFIFHNFNVVIWTAASKDYCGFIVNRVVCPVEKPKRQLSLCLWSDHGEASEREYQSPKSLDWLWGIMKLKGYEMNEHNCLGLDDYAMSTRPPPRGLDGRKAYEPNALLVRAWEFDPKDQISNGSLYLDGVQEGLRKWMREPTAPPVRHFSHLSATVPSKPRISRVPVVTSPPPLPLGAVLGGAVPAAGMPLALAPAAPLAMRPPVARPAPPSLSSILQGSAPRPMLAIPPVPQPAAIVSSVSPPPIVPALTAPAVAAAAAAVRRPVPAVAPAPAAPTPPVSPAAPEGERKPNPVLALPYINVSAKVLGEETSDGQPRRCSYCRGEFLTFSGKNLCPDCLPR